MIKILAMLFMLLDHICKTWFPDNIILAVLGRLSFPLFAWGISLGATFTKNMSSYILRLFILAVLSQPFYYLLFRTEKLNICFTFAVSLICVEVFNSKYDYWIKSALIVFISIFSSMAGLEYGIYGILTVLIFYTVKEQNSMILVQGILTLASTLIFKYDPIQLVAALSPIMCLFLSTLKLDFKTNRFVQYSFYPLHLLLLYLLKG